MKPKKIAVFESDAVNRFIYARMIALLAEKIEFHAFAEAEEGLAIAKKLPIDLVFIDLHFQGKLYHGIELGKKIKAISDKIVVVAMATFIQKGDIERTIAEGFTTCLEKPLTFHELERLIKEIK
jgi:CheY-like chemotaxis protein